MSSMVLSSIVFACVFGGALFGMCLRAVLPEHHLSADSKDVVKMGMGLIATMTALVLGLLIASTKNSYDTQNSEVEHMSANILLLDRLLAHYGPETNEARDLLRRTVALGIDRVWPEKGSPNLDIPERRTGTKNFFEEIQELSPRDDTQRALQARALQISTDLSQTRFLLFEQTGSSIPMPFLVVLVFWLTILFTSFGLFAPPNPTVIATLLVCALSVSGALFLILELDQPFEGVIQISSATVRNALAHLGQ